MTFTLLLRRIHLYLALFLTPWMLLYGLSILCMNRMDWLRSFYGRPPGEMYVERRMTYDKPLPTVVDPKAPAGARLRIHAEPAARQILQDLGIDGWHWADGGRDGSQLKIGRNTVTAPRLITYTAADRNLVVQRQYFHWPDFLRWLHKRYTYERPYVADIGWAICVDLVIVSVLAWAVSGLWLWYRIKPARRWGLLCVGAGCVLFATLVVTI